MTPRRSNQAIEVWFVIPVAGTDLSLVAEHERATADEEICSTFKLRRDLRLAGAKSRVLCPSAVARQQSVEQRRKQLAACLWQLTYRQDVLWSLFPRLKVVF